MAQEQLAALPVSHPSTRVRTWDEATRVATDAIASMKETDGSWKRRYTMWELITIQELIGRLPRGAEVADPSHIGPTPLWSKR